MSAPASDVRLAALSGRAALVVVDVQRDFGEPARLAAYGLDAAAETTLAAAVDRIAGLVDDARRLGVPVAWVELGSDPTARWRASDWLRSDAPGGSDPCVLGSEGAEWYRTAPAPGEIRVVKRGYSGFLGTDLAARLTAAGVDWLAVVGLTTECCVLATAQDAMQLDWPVVVPRDAVAAYTADLQEAALGLLALNVAAVAGSADLVRLWSGGTP